MAEGHRFSYTGNIPALKFQYPPERVKNQFANDGSFLEMFKKRMEEQMKTTTNSEDNGVNSNIKKPTTSATLTSNDKIILSTDVSNNLSNINNIKSATTPTPTTKTSTTNPLKSGLLPLVGKRRSDSRRSLKTGIVKKVRTDISGTADKKNASSKYTEEVKRYKATMCVEDEKSRPLVK